MKIHILILPLILIMSCSQSVSKNGLNEQQKEELKIDTEILKSLHDSLNNTGDYQFYDKYMLKIDEMINKYPDEKKELTRVKDGMKEIYPD